MAPRRKPIVRDKLTQCILIYRMWAVLDEVVDLNESDVYSYNPDADDDPMNEDGYL